MNDTADTVTILNALSNDSRGIERYQFADGVVWDKAKLRSLLSNELPVAHDDGYLSATSGQTLNIAASTLLANDFDPNGDVIRIVSVDGGANGTATVDSFGKVIFTPDAAFSGATSFTYTISDGSGGFATATVNLRVRPPASAINDSGFTVAEDGSINISASRLLSNDPGGDRMVVGQVLNALHGQVSLSSDGNIRFVPDLYYRGPAQFSYIANTPEGGSAQANVYLTVTPVNHAPMAHDDGVLQTLENKALTVSVASLLANDIDVDHDPLIITSVSSSIDLSVVLNANGTITATPNNYFYGATFFDYTIKDPSGSTSTARVTVNVAKRNTDPIAADDFIASYQGAPIFENQPIIITNLDLTGNDFDHEGDQVTITSVSTGIGGDARLLANGTVLFTPFRNFNGDASFSYTISDGFGGTGTAQATVRIAAVNQAPVAIADRYDDTHTNLPLVLHGYQDAPLSIAIIELLKNDFDIEQGTITFRSAGNADHGRLSFAGGNAATLDANGQLALTPTSTIIYTPDAGYFGDATFAYVIADAQGAITAGRVTVHFDPSDANAAPIANRDTFTMFEDVPFQINTAVLMSNDASAEGGPLTFVGWYEDGIHPLRGQLTVDDNGNINFVPKTDWFGETDFFYTVADVHGHTTSAEVVFKIIGIPDDPTAVDLNGFSTPLDVPLVISVKALLKKDYSVDYVDLDGNPLRPDPFLKFVGVDKVDHGTATVVNANGEQYIVVRFDPGYVGPVKITYRIADPLGLQGVGFLDGNVQSTFSGELLGTQENDLLIGSNVNEVIRTLGGTDTVLTGDGNNIVYLGSGNDTVTTGAGNDIIYAGAGDSVISTGAGDDIIYERTADLYGTSGADQIDGGTGYNTVDYSTSHTGVNVDLAARIGRLGDAQGDIYRNIQSIIGSNFADTLRSDDTGNMLLGGGGGDTLIGGAGQDVLRGGVGNDVLVGSLGADIMDGGTGIDAVDYSSSNAGIIVDLTAGTASGGYAQGDTLTNITNVTGTRFDDTIIGNASDNVIIGGQGNDNLSGADGNDLLIGGVGADVLDGGAGTDTVSYLGSISGVNINLNSYTATGGEAEGDMLTSIENLIGSNYNDTLAGDAADNLFVGGVGADVIDGGAGFNTASYASANAGVTVNLATGLGSGDDAQGDTLSNIQQLIGSSYDDTFVGTSESDTFRGGVGNDTLTGGDGSDTYLYGFGDRADTIVEQGSAANNDRIVLDAAIAPHDVSVTRVGNDMVLVFENQGQFLNDTIRVKDHFLSAATGVEQVVFANGTIWDRAELEQRSHEGVLNAQDDTYFGTEELTAVISPSDLFTNDVTGSAAGLTLVSVQNAINGTVSIDGNGNINFTGKPLYHGDAYFDYTVVDPYGRQSTARVQVQLASTNHAPVAINHFSIQGYENTEMKIPFSILLQGANDPDGDVLTVVDGAPLIDDQGNPIAIYQERSRFAGTNVTGLVRHDDVIGDYVSLNIKRDYYGFAGFKYEISDSNGGIAWADAQIYINHINQAPRINYAPETEETFTVRLGKSNTLTLADLLKDAIDPENDAIHFVGIHNITGGAAVYDPVAGTVSVTPTKLGKATETFQFDMADIYNATTTITVKLNVIPQFDPPVAHDDSGFSVLENGAIVIDPALLFANDTDPNGDTLILKSVDRFAKNGDVSIRADGKIIFIPRQNYNGDSGFHYQVTDSHGGVGQAWVAITINPLDVGAVLHDDVIEDIQDQPLTILPAEAFGNDLDAFGNVLFFHTVNVRGLMETRYLSKHVQFSATDVRGKALPDWLHFDATTMTFSGIVPTGQTALLNVEVKTFDPDNGNSFVHYFSFDLSSSGQASNLAKGVSFLDTVMKGDPAKNDATKYVIRGDFAQSFDFGANGLGATTSVTVNLADGRSLPSWLAFDATNMRLVGSAPLGTKPFATLVTYTYLDPMTGATQILRRNVIVDPAAINATILVNPHTAVLNLGAGHWNVHQAGNQPLPVWLNFDPIEQKLELSGYTPISGTQRTRIDVDFNANPVVLADGKFASSHGGFTLEFLIDPNGPVDPAINNILANSSFFASQGQMGVDLSQASNIVALLADGRALPSWLHFDADTLKFSGSPPPEFVGALQVRMNIKGNGATLPDFSILTDVVVDATYQLVRANTFATTTPNLVTLNAPIHTNGVIVVDYTTADEKGTVSTNTATDFVNIAPRLIPIRATNDSYALIQGHSVVITLDDLLANDRDDNGDYFRMTAINQPAHGSLVITGAHYSFAVPAGQTVSATTVFSAILADGSALPSWMVLNAQTGKIAVQPPLHVYGTYAVRYTLTDGAVTQNATANYMIDGNKDVSFLYTPDSAFAGLDDLIYTLSDGKQAPVDAHVALSVAPAVVAKNDAFTMQSDSTLSIGVASLLANDVSADGLSLSVNGVGQPSIGGLTFDGMNIVYTAGHYQDGDVTFTYTVSDGAGHSKNATVTLGVTSIDHAPTAPAIHFEAFEDSPLTINISDIMSHVTDFDGEAVQFISVMANTGTQAQIYMLPNGQIQFDPAALKYGEFGFTYMVTDGYKTSTGVLGINFAKINHAPIANPDGVFQTDENTPIRISIASLIANDADADGDTISITDVPRGINGSVVIDGTDIVFTPRAGYFGNAAFDYTLTDAFGATSLGRVTLQVQPKFHPAIAVSDSGFTMLQDTTFDIDPATLLANDIDPDGRGLTFLGFTEGPVTKLDNGLYRVTPAFNYYGPLVLTYAITNDSGVAVTTTATINVQHVPHAPNAVADHLVMTEDQPLVLLENILLANDFSLDGSAFAMSGISNAHNVSVAFDGTTGQLTVTPNTHFYGPAYFDYEILDSTGRTGTARANIDVAFVDYPPVIADIAAIAGTEEAPFSVRLPANTVTDVENDPALITLQMPGGAALPSWLHFDMSTLTIFGTPPSGIYGDVTLELRVDDGKFVVTKDFTLSIAHIAPPAPGLNLVLDSGMSATDHMTNNGTINVTGLKSGTSWQYSLDNGVSWVSGTGSSFTVSDDGAKSVLVRQTDTVGYVSTNGTFAFTLDTTAPVPTISLASDTGTSATDNITNNVVLNGTAEANSIVTIKDGTTTIGTATASATGAWTFTPSGLADGVHSFLVSQTDVAGNIGTASLAVTLDTTIATPALALAADTGSSATDKVTSNGTINVAGIEAGATWQYSADSGTSWATGTGSNFSLIGDGVKSVLVRQTDFAGNVSTNAPLSFTFDTTAPAPTLALVSDTGISATDKITNNVALKGTAEANSVVTINDGTTTLGTATANAAGAWSFTPTGLVDGAHSFSVSQTDIAGNTGTAILIVTLDSTAPVPTIALVTDSGASGTDDITNSAALKGTAEANSVVTIKDGTTILGTATASATGAWTFTPVGLADGVHSFSVNQTDVAGNTGTANLAVTFDTTPPVATILLVSDTGASASDGITNNVALKGTAEANSVVILKDGVTTLGTTTADTSGNWTLTPTGLADGAHSFTVSQTDVAGNTGAANLGIMLDTVAPLPTIALVTDSGASASDNITKSAALKGTAEANSVVTIKDGTTTLGTSTANAAGSWTFTPAGLADGAHSFTVSQTDIAGNTGTANLAVTLDTTAPVPTIALVTDSGTLATDGITNSAALNGIAEANSVVTIKDGTTILGTATANASGAWTFTPTGLADGAHSFTVSQTDVSGNTGTANLAVTLDTTVVAPTASLASDTGSSSTDKITNTGTINISGLEAGATWAYSTNGDSSWTAGIGASLTLTGDSSKSVLVQQTDTAGNVSASGALAFTLDTTALAPVLVLASDTGSSSTDQITSNGTVNVTGLEAGATWSYSINGGTTFTTSTGSSLTLTGDGAKSVLVRQTDAAGNVSASAALAFTLDTTAPVPTIALVADSGTSSTDNTTNNVTLKGTAEANSVVTIKDSTTTLGTATTDAAGAWTFTPTGLTDGAHSFTVSQTDAAGNTGTASLVVTLDTTAPTPTIALVIDSGTSATDNLTNSAALKGNAEANSVVTIKDGITTLGTATTNAAGAWTFTPTGLANGAHNFTVSQTDVAGNTGTTSLSVTLDTLAPIAPSLALGADTGTSATDKITSNGTVNVTGLEAGATWAYSTNAGTSWTAGTGTSFTLTGDGAKAVLVRQTDVAGNVSGNSTSLALTLDSTAPVPTIALVTDSGVLATDNITSNAALKGTAEANSVVTIKDGTTVLGTARADATGAWTFMQTALPTALVNGVHSFTVSQADVAGNTGSASLAVTLDTMATTPTLALAADTGTSATDKITNTGVVNVSGLEAGATWQYSTNAGTTWTVGTGSSVALTGDGAKAVIVRQTDAAGNLSANSASLAFTLDTTAPVLTIALVADSGTSTTDKITNKAALKGTAVANSVVTIKDGTTTLGTATASATGAWTFTPSGLTNGAHSFSVSQTDVAGNTGTASLAMTLDTTAAAVGAALAADTGASATDNITSNGLVNVSGLEAGAVWSYSINAGTTWTTGTGTSFTLTGAGAKAVLVRQTDVAGNISTNTSLNFTLDTVSAAPVLALAADTGSSATDKITSNGIVNVTGLEAGATWTYSLNAGTTWTAGTGTSIALTGDGAKAVIVRQTDVAGNVSANSTSLAFTLDTAATGLTAKLVTDSGSGATDSITNAKGFTGTAEAGAVVTILEGTTTLGTATASATGTWTITPTTLAQGAHSLNVSETDKAGNTASTVLAMTYDTTAPAVVISTAAAKVDVSNIQTITGTGEAGTSVQLFDGTTAIGSAIIVDAMGHWTQTVTLGTAATSHSVTAKNTDLAGNVGTSAAVVFTTDTIIQGGTSATVNGTAANDHIFINSANTTVNGVGGDDVFTFNVGASADKHTVAGGVGIDTLDFGLEATAITANIATGIATGSQIGTVTFNTVENVVGGSAGDTITGDANANALTGGAGNDTLTGGAGIDTFVYQPAFGFDTITDFTAGAGTTHDVLQLSLGAQFSSLAQVIAAATQVGANAVITIDANDTITLNNVNKTALVASNFVFV